ncbi:MAG: 4Fe-4S dicluster domain-containing protein [Chloroflexi bacterium]|nr:4Fe-4S dicluster domain-containing protein [Chloroflexota bacterium]
MSDTPKKATGNPRRGFLRALAGASGAAAVFATLDRLEASPDTVIAAYEQQIQAQAASADAASLDVLERMRQELLRALQKPASQRHWVMVIDLRRCIGCHACTIACVAENKLPPGVVYRPVLDEEIGTYPNVTRRFLPRPCMQCDNPPCTTVCPVNATYKNEDGVVVIDYNQCIGCRYCITACPYAARTFDFGYTYTEATAQGTPFLLGQERADDYERAANNEYGVDWERNGTGESPIGNVRKCHFCLHRIKAGMLPSCVTTCVGRATLFGDANDPDTLVARMIARPNVMRLKEELGTKPRVFYLL